LEVITRKSEVKLLLNACLAAYYTTGVLKCIRQLEALLLSKKVKFPLLEYCAEQFYLKIAKEEHLSFCDKIEALKTEGGNVILGIMLQKRLVDNFKESMQKATLYIADAHIWYICDIIGERVFGYALLHMPEVAIPYIKKLATHETNWVIRALGAGVHYAVKKGLPKKHIQTVFKILLSKANTNDKEIRQGIGWAAKTTAKFHPEIIDHFQSDIRNTTQVANWFRTKISIGLTRNTYAQRN